MATLTKANVSLNQGTNEDNRKFGYVAGEDGGFFFTHMPTLAETLNSIEVDEVDGDGGLTRDEVAEFLESYLPGKIRFRARQIRLVSAFGQFSVEGTDNNGEWVSIEPGSCSFSSRDEAESYISRWLDLNEDMGRSDDVTR